MIDVILWYILATIIGWLAVPLAYRFLPNLPDHGFSFARAIGLLIWGYIYWLLASLGVLSNNSGGAIFALVILVVFCILAGQKKWSQISQFITAHKSLIFSIELLFAGAFLIWALVRSANPEIIYTEKPMELAFINSILRSPTFPPADPWLSGYAISYYYFGYVMVALITRLSGTDPAVAFNLAIALWFALTSVGSFGVLYNLLAKGWKKPQFLDRPVNSAMRWAFLAPLFILLVSNLSGFLDVLHARKVFWQDKGTGTLESGFWKWLEIKEFEDPPLGPEEEIPRRGGGWIWWRGSRVVQDFDYNGDSIEVIDEFPFFSYLLGDLHPHVLSMPFVLLAIGLSTNRLFFRRKIISDEEDSPRQRLKRISFWFSATLLGGLAFLNTWDFPIYVALYSTVGSLVIFIKQGWTRNVFLNFFLDAFMVGIAGVVLYLPFYIGFSSQAGGFLPSLLFSTRGAHFWVMFAPLLLPITIWVFYFYKKHHSWSALRHGLLLSIVVVGGLWLLMMLVGASFEVLRSLAGNWIVSQNLRLQGLGVTIHDLAGLFFARQGSGQASLLGEVFWRRLTQPGTWLTLFILLTLTWGGLSVFRDKGKLSEKPEDDRDDGGGFSDNLSNAFILLVILIGILLAVFPEYFYLRDGFGTRMNTIFKFYFQTWILWGLAAAYASANLFKSSVSKGKVLVGVILTMTIFLGLLYPAIMLPAKTGLPEKSIQELTLDGTAYLRSSDPDELEAFQWLQNADYGVVAEAVGGQYNPDYARVATHTGLPTVLGWGGHEVQWRGGGEEIGSRDGDINILYSSPDWPAALSIIQRYNIRYVYVGDSERNTYRVEEAKFLINLTVVFENSTVKIFEVPDNLTTQVDDGL